MTSAELEEFDRLREAGEVSRTLATSPLIKMQVPDQPWIALGHALQLVLENDAAMSDGVDQLLCPTARAGNLKMMGCPARPNGRIACGEYQDIPPEYFHKLRSFSACGIGRLPFGAYAGEIFDDLDEQASGAGARDWIKVDVCREGLLLILRSAPTDSVQLQHLEGGQAKLREIDVTYALLRERARQRPNVPTFAEELDFLQVRFGYDLKGKDGVLRRFRKSNPGKPGPRSNRKAKTP